MRLAGVNLNNLIARTDAPTIDTSTARPVPDEQPNPPSGIVSTLKAWDIALSLQNIDRLSRYVEYDQMDTGDVASQLDAIVDAVLISDDARERSFKVHARNNKKYDNLIQDLIERLNLYDWVEPFLRETLKYGDVPVALWFDESPQIAAVQELDPYSMRRRVDRHGRLKSGEEPNPSFRTGNTPDHIPSAYWQVNPLTNTIGINELPIAAWYPWQLLWLMWRKNHRYVYSHGSYIEDMRKDWLKLRYMEASLVVARGTRAYPRRVIKLDTSGMNREDTKLALKDFKETLNLNELYNVDSSGNIVAGTKIKNPLEVDADLYIATKYAKGPDGKLYPQLNDVQFEDPRLAGIEHMGDIQYFRNKQYRRISPELMGVERKTIEVTMQDLSSARMFQRCANILEWQLLRPLIRLEGLLHGYTIQDADVDIQFNNYRVKTSWRHSDAAFRESMANKNDLSAGLESVKSIKQDNDHITDAEWDDHLKQLDVEAALREKGTLPPLDNGTKTGNAEPPNMDQDRKGRNSA